LNVLSLKKIDKVVGSLLTNLCPRPSQAPPTSLGFTKFLLVRPGGIGDAVLLIPFILALKEVFPDCEVTILAERRNGIVFNLCPKIVQVLFYDKSTDLLKVLRQRYDLIFDTEQWHRLSAIVARLVRSDRKIGFATNERHRLFTDEVPYSHENYEADSFFRLLEPLGINGQEIHYPFLQVPEQYGVRAEASLGTFAMQPFVVLFPGASIPERRWGADKFQRLAIWLNQQGLPVAVVGGAQDREVGERILAGCHGINLAGKTSLAETAAVLQRSQLLVSGDSGVLHLAVGLDVPTVSLFGPGIAAKWAPRGEKHIVLNKNLLCSPCTRFGYTPPCPIGGRCIQQITVDEVAQAVAALLSAEC